MEVPSLLEAQAHLHQIGFSLSHVKAGDAASHYELRDAGGSLWGQFETLLAFWVVWMTHAAEVLTEGRRADAFADDFEIASAADRRRMVDWHEARLVKGNRQPLDEWLSKFPTYTADTLPPSWKSDLVENLTGWVAGRHATQCMIAHMAQNDQEAQARIREWPAKAGLPTLQLID